MGDVVGIYFALFLAILGFHRCPSVPGKYIKVEHLRKLEQFFPGNFASLEVLAGFLLVCQFCWCDWASS